MASIPPSGRTLGRSICGFFHGFGQPAVATLFVLSGFLVGGPYAGAQDGSDSATDSRYTGTEWLDEVVPDRPAGQPRVLLIGDSVTRIVSPLVAASLQGQVDVAYMATSAGAGDPVLTEQVKQLLAHESFDVIQVNNGLHRFDIGAVQFLGGYRSLLNAIQTAAPHARLIVATSTPVFGASSRYNGIVTERNTLVKQEAHLRGIPVNDLNPVMTSSSMATDDGIHPGLPGSVLLSQRTSEALVRRLESPAVRVHKMPLSVRAKHTLRRSKKTYGSIALLLIFLVGAGCGFWLRS